jgi:hypothetical protein
MKGINIFQRLLGLMLRSLTKWERFLTATRACLRVGRNKPIQAGGDGWQGGLPETPAAGIPLKPKGQNELAFILGWSKDQARRFPKATSPPGGARPDNFHCRT